MVGTIVPSGCPLDDSVAGQVSSRTRYSSSFFERLENKNTTTKTASPIVKNTAAKSQSFPGSGVADALPLDHLTRTPEMQDTPPISAHMLAGSSHTCCRLLACQTRGCLLRAEGPRLGTSASRPAEPRQTCPTSTLRRARQPHRSDADAVPPPKGLQTARTEG